MALRTGDVVVPNLGPSPAPYDAPPVVAVLLILAMVGVALFVVLVRRAGRRPEPGPSLVVPVAVTVALMVVPLTAAYAVTRSGQEEVATSRFQYDEARRAAIDRLTPLLEARFGVRIGNGWALPTEDGESAVVIMEPRGGSLQKCFVIAQGTYEIRCGGGADPAGGTPLAPL